jgi:hypothetical protein
MEQFIHYNDTVLKQKCYMDASDAGFRMYGIRKSCYEQVKQLCMILHGTGAYMAGGFVRYCISSNANPAPTPDIDVFTQSEDSFVAACKAFENYGFKKSVKDDLVIEFNHPLFSNYVIQVLKPKRDSNLVTLTVGSPIEVVSLFDFTVIRCWIQPNSPEPIAFGDFAFYQDESKKRLRFGGIKCPINCMMRVQKFAARGYTLALEDAHKLFENYKLRPAEYHAAILKRVQTQGDSNKPNYNAVIDED